MKLKVLFIVALLFLATAAMADTFTFSYTTGGPSPSISGSGLFTTDAAGVITGISGDRNGVAILGIVAPGGYAGNDNKLFMDGSPFFTFGGVSFTVDTIGQNGNPPLFVNLAQGPGGGFTYTDNTDWPVGYCPAGACVALADVQVTPAPEPASLMLLGTGLALLASRLRKRR